MIEIIILTSFNPTSILKRKPSFSSYPIIVRFAFWGNSVNLFVSPEVYENFKEQDIDSFLGTVQWCLDDDDTRKRRVSKRTLESRSWRKLWPNAIHWIWSHYSSIPGMVGSEMIGTSIPRNRIWNILIIPEVSFQLHFADVTHQTCQLNVKLMVAHETKP